tara:strand:- start:2170 stop:2691 length:522 start_codon:yes stop_codon:yes gene_type:complete
MKDYRQLKITGLEEPINRTIADIQDLALEGGVEIRHASLEPKSNGKFSYNGILYVPEETRLPLAKGVVINDFYRTSRASYNFEFGYISPEEKLTANQLVNFIKKNRTANNLEGDVWGIEIKSFLLGIDRYQVKGNLNGDIAQVLNVVDETRNNPFDKTPSLEKITTWRTKGAA